MKNGSLAQHSCRYLHILDGVSIKFGSKFNANACILNCAVGAAAFTNSTRDLHSGAHAPASPVPAAAGATSPLPMPRRDLRL